MTSPASSATSGTRVPVDAAVAARGSVMRFLGWAGFSVLFFYAILVGGSWFALYQGSVRVVNLAVVAIGALAWLILAWRQTAWRPHSAIWPAVVVPWAAMALSALTSSNPRIGFEYVAWALLLVALYLLLVRILAIPFVRIRIGALLAAIALVIGIVYLSWTATLWIEWWGLVGELKLPPFRPTQLGLTWGSPSVLMAVQVLMVAAAAGGLGLRTRGARITVAGLLALTAVMMVVSGSRSAWLSFGGAVVVVSVAALLSPERRTSIVGRLRSRAGAITLTFGTVAVIAAAIIWGPAMVDRLAGYGDGGRLTYWATALRMFADSPLLGQGPGMWMPLRIAYTRPGEADLYQPHAHSQYLQGAAELGLIGLVAGAIALGCLAWLVMNGARSGEATTRSWAWASAFGLTYVALDTVVDVHTIPTVALLLGVPVAALDAVSARVIGEPRLSSSSWRSLRRFATILLVLGCSLSLALLARAEGVAQTHVAAVSALADEDREAALALAGEAATADPEIPAYHLTLGLAAAATGDWDTAESAFENATRADGAPVAWLGLAKAQAELGRSPELVAASLEEALRLGIQQPAVTFAVAQVYDEVGLTDDADDAYARTLAAEPSLAGDTAWRAAIGASRWAALTEAAAALAPDSAWEIALMSGDVERAQALVAGGPAEEERMRLIAARTGDAAAVRDVQRAALEAPNDPSRLAWAARASVWNGELNEAARFRRLIRLGPHYAPLAADVRAKDVGDEPSLAASAYYYYGTYTYRRPTPPDLLPPHVASLVASDAP